MSALHEAAKVRVINIPGKPTLKLYGFGQGPNALSPDPETDWLMLLASQGFACGVCCKLPGISERFGYRRFVTDHEHVRGWKKMKPEQRRQYVRGLLCYWCNKTYVGRGITIDIASGVLRYLTLYAERLSAAL
jgi:hypothetical protein